MVRAPIPLSVACSALTSVCRVFLANRKGCNSWIPLPPVASSVLSGLSIAELASMADRAVALVVRNTAHPCLYYSYARCRVLRKAGYPVQLNMGLHNLGHGRDAEGHCWLSLGDRVLFEEDDPCRVYPEKIGDRGDIVYWGRLGGRDERFLRLKKGE